jgi:hypothetical protein
MKPHTFVATEITQAPDFLASRVAQLRWLATKCDFIELFPLFF